MMNRRRGIRPIPSDRWLVERFYDRHPDTPGKSAARHAGIVKDLLDFDAAFFDSPPREAEAMDPQQRLLLELVWEALEDGGQSATCLRGSNTAVYVGVCNSDYAQIKREQRTFEEIYAASGTVLSITANRISHRFDWHGPSMAVDTACSSSLIATDLACRALWQGESNVAVAAGVNALLDTAAFISFSRANMLSPSGRISSFDAAADGYVRGEGGGVVVLKRLSAARRDGDDIYAVIRASGANQDGFTSTMTAPNPAAQEALMRGVCRAAGVDPARIEYVEAHGTGTPTGDPIEATAIGRTVGRARRHGSPALLGAVKPNIGHLESAAGVASLIKAALVLKHGVVPPNFGFRTPNPAIPFDALNLRIPREPTALRRKPHPPMALVNSFGFGGANACVLLESAAAVSTGRAKPRRKGSRAPLLVPISSHDGDGLRALAKALHDAVAALPADRANFEGVAATLATRRAHLRERALIRARDRAELLAGLKALSSGASPRKAANAERALWRGNAPRARKVAFCFSGQGSQWLGMGRELLASDAAFRAAVGEVDEALRPLLGRSVVSLFRLRDAAAFERTDIAQATIFALQMGLVAHWRQRGVVPDVTLGHSFGEVAAACAAGAIPLAEAARLVYHRGRLMERIAGQGRMIAVGLSCDDLYPFISDDPDVSIAAINSENLVTLSGPVKGMLRVEQRLKADLPDIRLHTINTRYAWHSRLVESVRSEFLAATAKIAFTPTDRFVSTVTGAPEAALGAEYWWRNMRQTVRYADGVRAALARDCDVLIEIGPRDTLTGLNRSILREAGRGGLAIASLSRTLRAAKTLEEGLCRAHLAGVALDWTTLAPREARYVKLPTHPWRKQTYQLRSEEIDRVLRRPEDHPLLGLRQPEPEPSWEKEILLRELRYLNDHTILSDVVFPATAYLEMMWSAAALHHGVDAIELENVEFQQPLVLTRDVGSFLRTELDPATGRIRIFGRRRNAGDEWSLHCTGIAHALARPSLGAEKPLNPAPSAALRRPEFYAGVSRMGWSYGDAFQGVAAVWPEGDALFADVVVPEAARDTATAGYRVHPTLLDSVLQSGLAKFLDHGASPRAGDPIAGASLFLPRRMKRVRFHRRFPDAARVMAAKFDDTRSHPTWTAEIRGPDGALLCTIEEFTARRIAGGPETRERSATVPDFYAERFVPVPQVSGGMRLASKGKKKPRVCIIALEDATPPPIMAAFADAGAVTSIGDGSDAAALGKMDHVIFALPRESGAMSRVAVPSNAVGLLMRWCDSLARAVVSLGNRGKPGPRIWVVMPESSDQTDATRTHALGPLQEAIRGFIRCLRAEYPESRASFVVCEHDDQWGVLAGLILESSAELEYRLHDGAVSVPRLEEVDIATLPPATRPLAALASDANYGLTMAAPGLVDRLIFEAMERPRPGPGEVLIEVQAISLNFRDLMAATGMLPEDAEGPDAFRHLGLECAGIVVDRGAGMKGFALGTRVVAVGRGTARRFASVRADRAFPIPDGITMEQAAAIPTAYLTAFYALHELARIAPGERVLIHNAAGGVGSVAVAIAQAAGAEVFATAGSDDKRDWLRTQGVRHVFDSRTLSFADDIEAIIGPNGIDVVLNALSGPFIDKNLSLLGSYGRYVEIGKRDVYVDKPIGLKSLSRNISMFVVDLIDLFDKRPQLARRMFEDVLRLIECGDIPLPSVTCFPASSVSAALRRFSQPNHIGKIVLTLDDPDLRIAAPSTAQAFVRKGGAYVVTGGNRGFGLAMALWLAQSGAGTLYLVSRSGHRPSLGGPDEPVARQLAATGVRIVPVALDLSDMRATRAWTNEMIAQKAPVHGIVHAAAVYDDAFAAMLDRSRIEKVLAPKVQGAIGLLPLAEAAPVDFFLLVSSIARELGSLGQSNYAAANGFLRGFAAQCRAMGIPALAVDWGAIADVGAIARSDVLQRYMHMSGVEALSSAAACAALPLMLSRDVSAIACARIDWESFSRVNRHAYQDPRLGALIAASGTRDAGGQIRARLAALRPAQRLDATIEYLRSHIAAVLGAERGDIAPTDALNRTGLDSLSAFELKTRIEGELRIGLPARHFLQAPTLTSLANAIVEALTATGAGDKGKDGPAVGLAAAGGVAAGELPGYVRERLPSLTRQGAQETSPVSLRQRAMIVQYLDPALDVGTKQSLTLAAAIRVAPRVDVDRLRAAAESAARRHRILRATFAVRGADIVHVIGPKPCCSVEAVDARHLTEKAFQARLTQAAFAAIDLAHGPTWSLIVFHRPDDQDVAVLRIHNVFVDGWSVLRLWMDLMESYVGVGSAPSEESDYGRFVVWQKRMLGSDAGKAHLRYWTEHLTNVPRRLPWDDRPRVGASGLLARRIVVLPRGLGESVHRRAAAQGVTQFSAMLTAYAESLRDVFGLDHAVVTIGAAGRTSDNISDVFGLVANNLHLNLPPDASGSLDERAAAVDRTVRGALEHQECPSAAVEAALRDAGVETAALGQVEFGQIYPHTAGFNGLEEMLFGTDDSAVTFGGITVKAIDLPGERLRPDIRLRYQPVQAGLYCRLEYNAERIDAAEAGSVLRAFEERLKAFAGIIEPSSKPAARRIEAAVSGDAA